MSISNLVGILQKYVGTGNPSDESTHAEIEQHFQQVSGNVPQEHLAGGIADVLRGGSGGSFPQMIGSLFSKSDGSQQAGILNHLISSLGPAASSSILGGVLGSLGHNQQLGPEQASQVPAEKVQELANQAQKANPSVVDQASSFYAQHPALVQSLGAGALAMIMSHVSRNHR